MKIFLTLLTGLLFSNPLWSDVTLIYELQAADGEKNRIKISIAGEGVRISENDDEEAAFILQAGHLFPLYRVNYAASNYQRMTPEFEAYLRVDKDRKINNDLFSYPPTTLKSTGKRQKIAGIKCRLIREYVDDKPVIEHCIANSSRSGLTEREVRSLVRTHAMIRKYIDTDWPGIGTTDEIYVAMASRHLQSGNSMLLKSVTYDRIDPSYLRIPRNFKLISSPKE